MKNQLSSQQIASYRENGFLVIPGFLDAQELAQWRDGVDEAVNDRGELKLPAHQAKDIDLGKDAYESKPLPAGEKANGSEKPAKPEAVYTGGPFLQRINLWMSSEKMHKIMLDPRLGKMASDLSGADGIRIWHDQALMKRPWDNPTGFHIDNFYWSFTSQLSISIWVALDDATFQNGCLYFLPGTHKLAQPGKNSIIRGNMNHIFEIYPEWSTIESVAAPMKAGSCSFHCGWTAHGAGPNMTPGWRRAMTCAYMPEGATFNGKQNVLPRQYMATLKVGDVLENNDQNPLIYSKVHPEVMVPA